jgi:hypothetical protein
MQQRDWFNNALSNAQLADIAARHWYIRHGQQRDFAGMGRCSLARTIEQLGVSPG